MRMTVSCLALTAIACGSWCAQAGDWPRFRGPDGSGVSSETGLPTEWSETQNLAWKATLPGPGSSSPIVAGDRVLVTCYSGYGVSKSNPGDPKNLVRHLVCLNLRDGRPLWQQTIQASVPEDPYEGMLTEHGYASSTPLADGQQVFAFFGKSGVYAFDLEGKPLWRTNVGTGSAIMGWGSGTSLVLHKNLVIVNANTESESLVALDRKTGREVWKAEAKGYTGSWRTPELADRPGGKKELVVFMPGEVWSLHPDDGGVLWYCTGISGAATTSVVAKEGIVYVIGGGPMGSGSAAIRSGGRDDVSASNILWKQRTGSYVPSPLLLDGHLYWVEDRGTACCLKADTGREVYRQRLPEAGGVYASLVAADGKLFAVTRRNGTFVLPAGPEFKVLARNRFSSDATDFNASPAVAQKSLLLRSNQALYCIRAAR